MHVLWCAALILIIASATTMAAAASTTSYTVSVSKIYSTPILSWAQGNSVFEYTYNPAAFQTRDTNEICLLVRCQNSTSATNPLGNVGPSHISVSCSKIPTTGFSAIKNHSVIFGPHGERSALGTEDPRVLLVNDTLYMYYTAVSKAATGGAAARLSLATCTPSRNFANPSCWQRRGPLFPDPTPGFQFTKSGALLYDGGNNSSSPLLIYGDCSIVNGLQVARVSPDLLSYNVITDFLLIEPRKDSFDSELVESGPPPLKLPTGDWLFFYNSAQRLYGVPNRLLYNFGYVILNGTNPIQVLQRSSQPLMMPTREWQTQGLTPYVVFVEGTSKLRSVPGKSNEVVVNVYYGAADSAVGVAEITVKF